MIRLWWDFYGPHAKGTAEHHARHVAEFLDRNSLQGETGVASTHPSHTAAFCDAAAEHAEIIASALKPKRRTEI